MTTSDAIRISRLHQIFEGEKLSDHQKDIAVMYVIGNTIEEIADEKGLTYKAVAYHLELVKRAVGSASLSGIRTIAFLRVLAMFLSN